MWKRKEGLGKKEREENESCKQIHRSTILSLTFYSDTNVNIYSSKYRGRRARFDLKMCGYSCVTELCKRELCIHVLYSNLASHDHKIFDWKILFLPLVCSRPQVRFSSRLQTLAKTFRFMTLISIYLNQLQIHSYVNCNKLSLVHL